MTDTNKRALEALENIATHALNQARSLSHHKEYLLAQEQIETIRTALQPKPSVDVEGLVMNYTERFEKQKGNSRPYYPDNHRAMIKAYIGQGRPKSRKIQRNETNLLSLLRTLSLPTGR